MLSRATTLRLVTVILILAVFIYKINQPAFVIFEFIVWGPLFLLACIIMFIIRQKDKWEYAQTGSQKSFLPSLTILLFIVCAIWGLFRDRPKLLFRGSHDGGTTNCSIEFYTDSTFSFRNNSWGSVSDHGGTFSRSDSVITLHRNFKENVLQTDRLLLTCNPPYKLIVQVDNHGIPVPYATAFVIDTVHNNDY